MNFLLILSSVLLNSLAQLLMRKGVLALGGFSCSILLDNPLKIVTNIWLILAILCFISSVFLWMIVLSKVEVSYAYPLSSIGFIVTALGGYFFLSESLSLMRISGILTICLGVYLISRS